MDGAVSNADLVMLGEAAKWLAEAGRIRDQLAKHDPGSVEHGRLIRSATAASSAANQILSKFPVTPRGRATLPAPFNSRPAPRVESRRPDAFDRSTVFARALGLSDPNFAPWYAALESEWHGAGNDGAPSVEYVREQWAQATEEE